MIARYTRPEMGSIWCDENKYRIWLDIEIAAVEAQALLGIVPQADLDNIKAKAQFDVQRILEIEETTKHDVIAFLTNVAEYVGESARYIHLGMTSSDILDTCLSIQMKQAGELLLEGLQRLRDITAQRAQEFKYTICIGRTHGIHAEPTTFGLKFLLWHEETKRNIRRLTQAIDSVSVAMISGAVGTYEHISMKVEEYVARKLGLKPDPITTQIIQRDRHAEFLLVLALIGASLEKIALEVRHLQRTEVLEVEEYFSAGQKGSSAMPHKRNPIMSERICGLARVLRGNAIAAMENVGLWHERDISHSSVERIVIPDSTIILDYMLHLTNNLLRNLLVYPETMQKNLHATCGLIFSQTVLLELVKRGVSREDAYAMVQRNAMRTWKDRKPFLEHLRQDADVTRFLSHRDLEEIFSIPMSFLSNIDAIFARCGIS
ncbi:MAG: adenylosuccinate lyase [Bacteroidota bacterium]|nr:adenylosuccinate lyase [Candidatus Kapabacteria bacterium]MDW8218964.1 adenylosuccinate lyase [Bacteroidota bacterium]